MVLKFYATPWPFCVALSPSVQWQENFYCCTSKIFFLSWILSVAISRWQDFNSLYQNPGLIIRWLPLFWSTWSLARRSDLATCAGLAHVHMWPWAVIIAMITGKGQWSLAWLLYSLRAKVSEKAWPLFFFEKPKIRWPTLRVFQTLPPRLLFGGNMLATWTSKQFVSQQLTQYTLHSAFE